MLAVAKILKSNGTDGGLLVSSPEYGLDGIEGPVFVYFDGLPVPFFIDDCTPRGTGRYIVHLTDIRTLKDAEEVVGRELFADVEDDAEGDDADLVGWKVYDRDVLLGVICEVAPIPGNLCVSIERADGGESLMIPLHEDFIVSVDNEAGIMRLELPEGLY